MKQFFQVARDNMTPAQIAYQERYESDISTLSHHLVMQLHAGAGDLMGLGRDFVDDHLKRSETIASSLQLVLAATGQPAEDVVSLQPKYEAAAAVIDEAERMQQVENVFNEMNALLINPGFDYYIMDNLTSHFWLRETDRQQFEEERLAFPEDWEDIKIVAKP